MALFYVETRDDQGRLRGIHVNRLKDKLGTRKVPTAELTLDGAPAQLVAGMSDGVRQIVPMLHVTRTWNSVTATAFMRRGLALARDYARRRVAFGAALAQKPLHVDTLATLQAEMEGAFLLSFYLVELLGLEENGGLDTPQSDLLRLLTSVAKLTTARQAVAVASEALEAFGGAGYVEDTGLPALLRDSQVLPIWEGTTNVLALDTLRALAEAPAGWGVLEEHIIQFLRSAREPRLAEAAQLAAETLSRARRWLDASLHGGSAALEPAARRFALTLGRTLELALLIEQAQWALDTENDMRPRAAALRFAHSQIDLIADFDAADAQLLADDS